MDKEDGVPIMRAAILCAGYGTRLGPLTEKTPKPMLPIAGRPLLEYTLVNLARHGFREVVVNLHFKPDRITRYFGDGARWGVSLSYSYEPELLGTAGALRKMEAFLRAEPFFMVHYGDVLTDQDYAAMTACHKSQGALATLLLHRRARSNSVVETDGTGRIVRFLERPRDDERPEGVSWVNSGVCILDAGIFEHIPQSGFCDLPRDVFARIVPEKKLRGFPLTGYRCAVDSPERYAEAQRAVADGECFGDLHFGDPQSGDLQSEDHESGDPKKGKL